VGENLLLKVFKFNNYPLKLTTQFRWRRVSVRGKARKVSRKASRVVFKIGKTHRTLYNNFNLVTRRVSKYAYLVLVKKTMRFRADIFINCVFISIYGILGIFIKVGKKIFKRGKLSSFR